MFVSDVYITFLLCQGQTRQKNWCHMTLAAMSTTTSMYSVLRSFQSVKMMWSVCLHPWLASLVTCHRSV